MGSVIRSDWLILTRSTLMITFLLSCLVRICLHNCWYSFDAGSRRKSPFQERVILPQTGYSLLYMPVGCGFRVPIFSSVTIEEVCESLCQERAVMPSAISSVDSVSIKVLKLHQGAQLPRYAHTGLFGDLAADLYAADGAT